MDEKTKQVGIVVALLLAGCLIIGIGMAILGLKSLSDSVNLDVGDLSFDLDDCVPGSSGSISMLEMSMNLTVVGRTAYRERQVCHSRGPMSYEGELYSMDLYRVKNDDECFVLIPVSDESIYVEDCEGSWPGFVPADGG